MEGTSFSREYTGENPTILTMTRPMGVKKKDGGVTYDGQPMKYDKKSDTFYLIRK